MQTFPPSIILRHRKENLKKCSLRGLENRPDFRFFTYPVDTLPNLSGYIVLQLDAPPLTHLDASRGLFLIDATWRYATVMSQQVSAQLHNVVFRSIPPGFRTAYPRCQTDCPDPEHGLASIEALYLAYRTLGRAAEGLLDNYYWKNAFLIQNNCADPQTN